MKENGPETSDKVKAMSSIRTQTCILGSSTKGKLRARGNTCGEMERYMRGSGTRGGNMGMGCGGVFLAIPILDNGGTQKPKDLEYRSLKKAIGTKVSGDTASKRAEALNNSLMEKSILETTSEECLMAMVSTSGMIKATTKVPSLRGLGLAKANG